MRTPTSVARVPQMKLAALAVMSCFASAAALANPTGVISSSGVVSMATPAPNVLEITNNPGAIINWQGFSISAGELTRFIQNSASSAVLNRVMGPAQSDILGTLTSNGRVFLINPNGITIGAGAVLDLPGFVASSLNMTDADFLDGRMRFQQVPGTTAGAVTNHANISLPAGGQVYLIGGTVKNDAGGIINSPNGDVVLAAGHSVELMSTAAPGVSVEISATDNAAVNLGQVFAASGRAGIFGGVVNQGGLVSANSVTAGADGSIKLVATQSTNFAPGSSTTGGALSIETGTLEVGGSVNTGPQVIEASGAMLVRGGRLDASGGQSITAGSLEIDGAAGAAIVSNSFGEQTVEAQRVTLSGGASGTNNFALLRALNGPQTIVADEMMLEAGVGGTSNFAAVIGAQQSITVHRDATISGGNSASTPALGGGALIGGGGSLPTNLVLTVGGDLALNGGARPGSGGAIGASNAGRMRTDITLNVGGDLTMTPGSGTGTRIGGPPEDIAGGNIVANVNGAIAMNSAGPGLDAVIRTADGVTLNATSITQGAEALIEAGTLDVLTQQGASLTGRNAVGQLSLSNQFFGDVAFNNTADVLTVTRALNASGAMSLRQAGDMQVVGDVFSGPQAIDVTGGLRVENAPFSFAQIGANGGQTINAGYVELVGSAGGSASIFNFGGEQRITTSSANAAGEGLAVRAVDNGFAIIDAPTGSQTIEVRDADRMVVDAAGGAARVTSTGGRQTIALTGTGANALQLGSPDARFQSFIAADDQTVVAGNPGEQGSITVHGTVDGSSGTAQMITWGGAGGNQSVSTSGALGIFGGSAPGNSATGIFSNQAGGHQTISAESILIQGGDVGFGNSAMIGANSGSQTIHAGAGGITLRGGAAGGNNFVQINQASTDPAATQTITSAGPVLLEGGSGNFNFAMIRAFGGHQDLSFGDTTLLAGAAGIDNFSVIQGRNQDVTVHGDLEITARGSAGSPTIGGGARIGGLGGGAPTPTQLRLNVGGNLTMTAGDAPGTGVTLGNTSTFAGDTDISVNAGGSVTLNGGSVPDTLAAIGSRAGSLAGGDVGITAGSTIALNSTAPDQASTIRTTNAVTLSAQQITQGPDAIIEAGSLSTTTFSGTDLDGANALANFHARNFAGGDVVLHNTSPQLIVTGIENFGGGLTLQQTGDLLVTGLVFTGVQDVDVSGGLIVRNEPFSFAQLSATGGQTIDAGYVEVIGSFGDGMAGGTLITNFGGDQRIATSGANGAGESLALKSSNGAAASILSGGGQQTILLTGPGPNALVMASADGMFGTGTSIAGDQQTIVAGNSGESGSITLRGPISQIGSSPLPGGSQTVATSGTLTLAGSDTDFSFGPAGIFASSPDGLQTVRAEAIRLQGGNGGNGAVIVAIDGSQLVEAGAGGISLTGAAAPGSGGVAIVQQSGNLSLTQTVRSGDAIVLQGGSLGGGNLAEIVANGGAQAIDAGAGGITLRGGDSGGNNFARIHQLSTDPAATQTVVSAGDVRLEGGNGSLNFAMLRGFGARQTLESADLVLQSGPGGVNNFATIQARRQDLTVHGDLEIRAGGSAGTPGIGGGARIGGVGSGVQSGTDLTLAVAGDLTMTAGSVSGTGVSLGSNIVDDLPSNIAATVGGNVTLNGGSAPGTFARVGSANSGATGGFIDISAAGIIALNSTAPDQASIIRTTEAVTLSAQQITQGPDARIEAGSLSTTTFSGTDLDGANSVSLLAMRNTASGNVAFNNSSAQLTVTGIDQVPAGALSLTQAGNLRIIGDVTSGAQSIGASGDLTIAPGVGPNVTVEAYGPQTFNVGGSFSLLGGTAWNGYAQTLAKGAVSVTTGGDLNVRGGSGLLAYALLYGSDDIRLTIGDELRIDGGSGLLALARVQTDLWDRIFLDFPNRASGGYFVNGREGVTHRGLDGFFTGLLPARRGRSLVVTYGE